MSAPRSDNRHRTRGVVALVLVAAVSIFAGRSASPLSGRSAAAPDAAGAALAWLEGELAPSGGGFVRNDRTDWGLTVDAVVALGADRAISPVESSTLASLVTNVDAYVTWDSFGAEYGGVLLAGPTAKAHLALSVGGVHPATGPSRDLTAELLSLQLTTGPQAGRFVDRNPHSRDLSNLFGQAWAILALDRTSAGAPDSAVEYALSQQCPSGAFPLDGADDGCTDDANADTDVTALVVQALLAVDRTAPVEVALGRAVRWMELRVGPDGGVGGTGPTAGYNANSAALVAEALDAGGRNVSATRVRTWLATLQLRGDRVDGTPLAGEEGAVAYSVSTFEAARVAGIGELARDQWRRSTTQAVLGFAGVALSNLGREVPKVIAPVVIDDGSATSTTTPSTTAAPTTAVSTTTPSTTPVPTTQPESPLTTLAPATSAVPTSVPADDTGIALAAGGSGASGLSGGDAGVAVLSNSTTASTSPAGGSTSTAGGLAVTGSSLSLLSIGAVLLVSAGAAALAARGARRQGMRHHAAGSAPLVLAVAVALAGSFAAEVARATTAEASTAPAAGSGALSSRDAAAFTDGPCPTSSGVTVVIDFQELGGGVHVRCSGTAPDNGLDALRLAGIGFETAQLFDGFVCRIAGEPADDPCINASPSDAYWSYWVAPRGGSWCYATSGAGRTPPAGTVEGWSFAKDKAGSEVPSPRYTPPAAVPGSPRSIPGVGCTVPAPAPTPPAPRPPAPTQAQPTPAQPSPGPAPQPTAPSASSGNASASSPAGAPSASASGTGGANPAEVAGTSREKTGSGTDRTGSSSTTTRPTSTGSPDSTTSTVVPGEGGGHSDSAATEQKFPPINSTDVDLASSSAEPDSSPVPAIGGLVLVAVLGGVALLIARRRGRRETSSS